MKGSLSSIKVAAKLLLSIMLVIPMWPGQMFNNGANVVHASSADWEDIVFDFTEGLEGWSTTGSVTVNETGGQDGGRYVALGSNAVINRTITGIPQGSYTLSVWARGAASGNTAKMVATNTGGPDAVALIDDHVISTDWRHIGHRNVLVYNGQVTIQLLAGARSGTLSVDRIQLSLDTNDNNPVHNWGFEEGISAWDTVGTVDISTEHKDTGTLGIVLHDQSQVSQVIPVKPNTSYIATMRARVDNQDTYVTIPQYGDHTSPPRRIGEIVERTSLGNRVNIGVKNGAGDILRQAPSGTTGYSLVTIAFQTGPDEEEVTLYANTLYDEGYRESVSVHGNGESGPADEWQGNGTDKAYVDNFNVFQINNHHIKGSDVSFLPLLEDLGGKFFANGVQQDALRIISNHGSNSIISKIFVRAGNYIYDPDDLTLELNPFSYVVDEHGNILPRQMQEGYFDKEHILHLSQRATELGMSFMPGFQYSDTWMSQSKAYTSYEWIEKDYEGQLSNANLEMMKTAVYNYVYDFLKTLADHGVNVVGVKHGNEQNGGLMWPTGRGGTSAGHAALVNASVQASREVLPGVSNFAHSNNGYDPNNTNSFFGGMLNQGAQFDGLAYSLYGGRPISSMFSMMDYIRSQERFRFQDYVNVETGFSFTQYNPSPEYDFSSGMGQSQYFARSANGQYNFLLDYMQAPLDRPNPYGQTRGFYYWETDWLPVKGAGTGVGRNADVSSRIMFNNGDVNIREMGSVEPGKSGDMMDSMYAYLMRGYPKDKPSSLLTPLKGAGTYSVQQVEPAGITFTQTELSLMEGKVERIRPIIAPVDQVLTDSQIHWSSSNPAVAAVSPAGFVYGVGAGTTTITGKVGDVSNTITVTVAAGTKAQAGNLQLKIGEQTVNNGDTVSADVFDKLRLAVTIPAPVTDKAVIFKSDNSEMVSFFGETWQTPAGEMRQFVAHTSYIQMNVNKGGSASVTVSTADGGDLLTFTVNATSIPVEDVQLSIHNLELSRGDVEQLVAAVAPANATFYRINWSSSDENVAKVDQTGLVTALAPGTAAIRATSDQSSALYDEVEIQVNEVEIFFTAPDYPIAVGKKVQLEAEAENLPLQWRSDNAAIATVNASGELTAVGAGMTAITVTDSQGNEASIQVEITNDISSWYDRQGGTVSATASATGRGPAIPLVNARNMSYRDTAWSPGNNTAATWTVDLGDMATIEEIYMVAWATQRYAISVSENGTDWETVADRSDGLYGEAFQAVKLSDGSVGTRYRVTETFSEKPYAKYIRVSIQGASGSNWVSMEVFQAKGRFGTEPIEPEIVPVSGVSVVPTLLTLTAGGTSQLTAAVTPEDATNKAVSWISSNTSVAEVSADGLVTAIAAGETEITVTTEDGSFQAYVEVIVEPLQQSDVEVTGVSVAPTVLTLTPGSTLPLTVIVMPENATNKAVSWSSSSTEVAEVSADGVVMAIAVGEAEITVTTEDGLHTAKVQVMVSELNIHDPGYPISTGRTVQLAIDAVHLPVQITSSNEDVATVSPDGQLNAVGAGATMITVADAEGNETSVQIEVTDDISSWYDRNAGEVMATLTQSGRAPATPLVNARTMSYRDTAWTTGGNTAATWELDLGDWAVIEEIYIVSWAPQKYTISVSETGTDWEVVADRSADFYGEAFQATKLSDGSIGTRYRATEILADKPYAKNIRVTFHEAQGSNWVSMEVFQAKGRFGIPSTSPEPIAVTGVSVTPTELTLTEGDVSQLTAAVAPASATNKAVSWNSSNMNVAEVSASGLVTAKQAGTTTITVTTEDGAFTAATQVTVEAIPSGDVSVTGVSVTPTELTVTSGGTSQLTATVAPANATNKAVSWNSSNMNVAEVSASGLVTAKQAGTTTITVTTEDGSFTAATEVTVQTAPSGNDGSSTGGGTTTSPVQKPNLEIRDGKGFWTATPDSDGNIKVQLTEADTERAVQDSRNGVLHVNIVAEDASGLLELNLPVNQLLEREKSISVIVIQYGNVRIEVDVDDSSKLIAEDSEQLTITIHEVNSELLPADVAGRIGNHPVYDFSLLVDGQAPRFANNVTVKLTYALQDGETPSGIVVYFIDNNGELHVVKNSQYDSETAEVSFQPPHFSRYAISYTPSLFEDLESAMWAKEMIESLAAKQIISGVTAQSFQPGRSVTRAEFLKMILNALELTSASAAAMTFEDVTADRWYYDVVSIGYHLGIVSGKSEQQFGANDAITREDMAVMLYRALKLKGMDSLETAAHASAFADENDLAVYALQAVKALHTAGIVSGFEDGSFGPKQLTTRAQAAAIIYRILSL